jgi:hypothetical protein
MTFNATNNNLIYFYCAGANGDVGITTTGDNIYIQDAQVEQGLVARDYIETTTSAVEGGITDNVPRLDYTDSSCPALLLEPQRTNLISHSEYFGAWSLSNATLTANDAESPEGVINGYKLNENTTNSTHRITQTSFVTAGQGYTQSVFAKGDGSGRYLRMFRGSGTYNFAVFNLTSGEILSQGGSNLISTNIEAYPNGWYKCSITFTAQFSNIASYIGLQNGSLDSYAGDGTSGIYIYGATLEAGTYPTSYIPTYGSSVTRVADYIKIIDKPILQATNQFTLFFEADDFLLANGTSTSFDNVMFVFGAGESAYNSGTGIHIYNRTWYYYNGSNSINMGSCYNALANSKFAISYDGSKFTKYANGVKLGTFAVSASMSNWDSLNSGGTADLQGDDRTAKFKEILLLPTALTDQEAIDLTTI